ncbi:MAG: IS110 family transposase [Pyrinomonadaceae bacterium]|nr:IS110 family transposase [Pyrinomonadaceae bacterium]
MEQLAEHFAALIGIDWSDTKHDVCLVDTATGSLEPSVIKHTPESLNEWARGLRQRFGGAPIAVCLEQSRGPLIYALLKYDFLVLYPINPKTLAKFREAFSPSRAKDDPTDAEYLVELLVHHRDRLKPWRPDDQPTRTLQLLVEHRRRLVGDQTRISNRLTALLKGYFPQVLAWFPEMTTVLVCDFLLRWSSLDALSGVRRATLEKFFREHKSHRTDTIEKRLDAITAATALTTDGAVINASVVMVKALAAQMKTTLTAIKEFDREIAELCQAHADYEVFASLPGAGPVYASRLLTAMGTRRERWASADELLRYSGVAPVIERSGKSEWIRWRYFCPKFLRQSFVEYAGESIRHCVWAKAYYQGLRAKGQSHQAAVRALAYKWIRIIYRCWQTRTNYDEARYMEVLRNKGSVLVPAVATVGA